MAQDFFNMGVKMGKGLYSNKPKKKRQTLSPAKRIYIWERPNIYGRTCSICHRRITQLSDLELDHTRAYSKGGTKLALAHKDCNRLKSSGGLKQIQKSLGIKTKTKRRISKKKPKARAKEYNPFDMKLRF